MVSFFYVFFFVFLNQIYNVLTTRFFLFFFNCLSVAIAAPS